MEPAEWTAETGPAGPRSVIINGADVTDAVEAFGVACRPGQLPVLSLYLKPGQDGTWSGPGIVELSRPGSDIATFLKGLSPDLLSSTVSERLGYGDGGDIFSIALTVLAEWAGAGAPPQP